MKLSIEHSGFKFENDPKKSAEPLKKHSGVHGSKASLMAVERDKKDEQVDGSIGTDEEPPDNEDSDAESETKDSPVDLLLLPKERSKASLMAVERDEKDEQVDGPIGKKKELPDNDGTDAESETKDSPVDVLLSPRERDLSCFRCFGFCKK